MVNQSKCARDSHIMPSRPSVRCKHPGCSELIQPNTVYCTEHRQARWRAEKVQHVNDPFYGSKAWRAMREAFIRANPFCKICAKEGTTVDHIQPRRLGGASFDPSNLQTLCKRCDQVKRGKESFQHREIIRKNSIFKV